MNIKEIILYNLKVLDKYRQVNRIKSEAFMKSSVRSNLSRNDIPKIENIISICNDFDIEIKDFITKKIEISINFVEVENA